MPTSTPFITLPQPRYLYIAGIIYVLVITIAAAVVNYLTWEPGAVSGDMLWIGVIFWILLYLPVFIFWRWGSWKLDDFGFTSNLKTLAAGIYSLPIGLLCAQMITTVSFEKWYTPVIEGFARAGEEIFYRGFIYMLIYRLFENRKRPWLWAVFLSSLLFMVVHTQVFLPGNQGDLAGKFFLALVFALARAWSGSVLFGVSIHAASSGGILGMLTSWAIYAAFTAWALKHRHGLNQGSGQSLSGVP
jgi:membrane protease YdiL (CAAX protease family)